MIRCACEGHRAQHAQGVPRSEFSPCRRARATHGLVPGDRSGGLGNARRVERFCTQRKHSQGRSRRVQCCRKQASRRGVDQLSLPGRLHSLCRNPSRIRCRRCTDDLTGETMDIFPIRTRRDYRRALKAVEGLMTARRNTPEGDRLDVLVTLIEAWERKHYPLDLPDPIEAIKYHMDQNGLAARDLIPFIGSRNRVYEVLNRKRPLTLRMVWRLHEGLGIP